MPSLAYIVPENTSRDELKKLINEFRSAREGKYLDKMIPATTPGGALGDYGIVWILVFSDKSWGSWANLKAYTNGKNVDKELIKHIRAEYYYGTSEAEYGNLGCRDEKALSPEYENLFCISPHEFVCK